MWRYERCKWVNNHGSISKEIVGDEGLCALPRQNDKSAGKSEGWNKRPTTCQNEGFAKGKTKIRDISQLCIKFLITLLISTGFWKLLCFLF